MSLPYTMRLLRLCCASFFMIHLALALATRLGAGAAVRMAGRMKAASAARFLFALRMLPAGLTLFAVLAFCIPSYLWLEPQATGEKVGLVCAVTAIFGMAIWAFSFVRVVGAVRGTSQYLHRCERHGRKVNMPGEASPALVLAGKVPVLAVAGVLRPQLVISRRVMRGLSPEQREAALRHERAHRTAGDNLKRFLMLLVPDVCRRFEPFPASNIAGRSLRNGRRTTMRRVETPNGPLACLGAGPRCPHGLQASAYLLVQLSHGRRSRIVGACGPPAASSTRSRAIGQGYGPPAGRCWRGDGRIAGCSPAVAGSLTVVHQVLEQLVR